MKKQYIIPAVFTALLIVIGLLYFIVPDVEISEEENRKLTQLPEFSFGSLFDGSYTSAMGEYMKDQFPFRRSFIEAGGRVSGLLSLGGSEVDMVISTGNMDMGEGETLAKIPTVPKEEKKEKEKKDEKPAPAKIDLADEADYNSRGIIIADNRAMELFGWEYSMLKRYATMVNIIAVAVPDAKVYSLVVPTSVEFYSPVKYHEGRRSQKTAIDGIYGMLAPQVSSVDAYTYLAAAADRYIYFRTDHHWTVRGAYQGYYAFCKAAGLEPVPEDSFSSYNVEGDFLGTLYRYTRKQVLSDDPDTVEVMNFPEVESCVAYTDASMSQSYGAGIIVDPGESTNKYLTFLGGDNPLLHIVTKNKNGRRVAILKDSFGNAFTPFLINHYEEIYALDSRSAGVDIIEFCASHDIDDIIIENYAFAISNKEILGGLDKMVKDSQSYIIQ
ncbi:MAG: hypothetical protein J1F63_06360 [Oscillospiraceae bacterium]|nr:hypothetical protein [Oscillospiraceae bacterium]